MKGWLAAINRERQGVRQVTASRELARLFDFYSSYHIMPSDNEVSPPNYMTIWRTPIKS